MSMGSRNNSRLIRTEKLIHSWLILCYSLSYLNDILVSRRNVNSFSLVL